MNITDLKNKTKKEIYDFIRNRLKSINNELIDSNQVGSSGEHISFIMSGYEDNTGKCTIHNINILNEFADLGIYDYTSYLFLDFYKGCGSLYLRYWDNEEVVTLDGEYCGWSTTEIIYDIFKRTIFSNRGTRRRR